MHNVKENIKELLDQFGKDGNATILETGLSKLYTELNGEQNFESLKTENIHELLKEFSEPILDNTYSKEHVLKTGFKDFDRCVSGLCKGDLLIIGGRPGMGKTQFMLQLAVKMAQLNGPVSFISLEGSKDQLSMRVLSMFSKIQSKVLLEGRFSAKKVQDIANSIFEAYEMPLDIIVPSNPSIHNLLNICRQLAKKKKPVAIFIDSIQLITNSIRKGNRENELSYISRELKKLARELNITFIVSSQLNRSVESRPGGYKMPQLSDLKDSGSIEQDADKVLMLYRAEYYGLEMDDMAESTKNILEIMVAKNNVGPPYRFKMKIIEGFLGFSDFTSEYGPLNPDPGRLEDLF